MVFEWDDKKEKENIRKHKISFSEAKSVFDDENALVIYDPDHSKKEERFVILGMDISLRILVVCHCYKYNAETIRIISARKATKNEAKEYGGIK
jgi:uncharacterized DUF497 family protein